MSKSYGNTIGLSEDPAAVEKKIRGMNTDPARVRRTDPGDPDKCPGVGSAQALFQRRRPAPGCAQGCSTAGIGCLECKKPLWEKDRRRGHASCASAPRRTQNNPGRVREILAAGRETGRQPPPRQTMQVVRKAHEPACLPDHGRPVSAAGTGETARAGGDAIRHRAGRAAHRNAARPVHPAAGDGGVPRCLRGSARPAAVPDPAAEPEHPRHSHRRDHAPVHAVHRADERAAARARRRVPGDGRDAGRDQVAHAAAARGAAGRRRGRGSARRAGAPPAGIRALQAGRAGSGPICRAWSATPGSASAAVDERRVVQGAAGDHAEGDAARLQGRGAARARCSRTTTSSASRCRCARA